MELSNMLHGQRPRNRSILTVYFGAVPFEMGMSACMVKAGSESARA
jgi:hypothetical protein